MPVSAGVASKDVKSDTIQFHELGLDTRLLQAIAEQNFNAPTPVQAKAIPLALAGKDILARSQTGSGKTAAYVLPILQSILQRKAVGDVAAVELLLLIHVVGSPHSSDHRRTHSRSHPRACSASHQNGRLILKLLCQPCARRQSYRKSR